MTATPLRLIADDLTGALDSAASFASPSSPVSVLWECKDVPDGSLGESLNESLALSTESREASASEARARTAAAMRALTGRADGALVFKKIDSLLRGHPMLELATAIETWRPDRVVVAPAYPALGRITRGGWQFVRDARTGEATRIDVDLAANLRALGFESIGPESGPAFSGEGAPGGGEAPAILLLDAESDADLEGAAMRERARGGRILWCGSGGLAEALACARGPFHQVPARRVLAVIGSDHPVAVAQVRAVEAASAGAVIPFGVEETAEGIAARIDARLTGDGVALVPARLPDLSRAEAARLIAGRLAGIMPLLSRPDVVYASGGETLRAVCDALGARALAVEGFVAPGIPLSRFGGGRWAGLPVISKSGAFGDPTTLARLLGLPVHASPDSPSRSTRDP